MEKPASGSNRWQGGPRVYTRAELPVLLDAVRDGLMIVEQIAQRMENHHIESVEIPAGSGAKAYDRIESSLSSWIKGLQTGMREQIKRQAGDGR